MMNKEAETGMMGKQEVEGWVSDINKQIEGEMDEWKKERLVMERWVLTQVLTGKRGSAAGIDGKSKLEIGAKNGGTTHHSVLNNAWKKNIENYKIDIPVIKSAIDLGIELADTTREMIKHAGDKVNKIMVEKGKGRGESDTPIYETLKPNEALIISKSRNGIVVAYNIDGKIEIERIPLPK